VLNLVKIHSGILNLLQTDKHTGMIKLMDMMSQLFTIHLKKIYFLKIKLFYAVTPCRLVNIYWRFGRSTELNTRQHRCEEPKSHKYATFPKKYSWPL